MVIEFISCPISKICDQAWVQTYNNIEVRFKKNKKTNKNKQKNNNKKTKTEKTNKKQTKQKQTQYRVCSFKGQLHNDGIPFIS